MCGSSPFSVDLGVESDLWPWAFLFLRTVDYFLLHYLPTLASAGGFCWVS